MCYDLVDIDGDGKFDRFIYDDLREQGERAATLGRTPFVAEVDFDERAAPARRGARQLVPPLPPPPSPPATLLCASWHETPWDSLNHPVFWGFKSQGPASWNTWF